MIFLVKRFIKVVLIISEYSPFAIVYLVKAVSLDWLARRWAFWRLPSKGGRIGLQHNRSDYIREFGTLAGRIQGHKVIVEPFAPMTPIIRVYFKHTYHKLELSLRKSSMVLPPKAINFSTSDWKFNTIFRTKRARKDMVHAIESSPELLAQVVAFYSKWIFKIDAFIIGERDLFCRLKYGFNFNPHIPPSKLQPLVEELTAIAERLEAVLAAYKA